MALASAALMQRRPIFRSSDVDETCAFLNGSGLRFDLASAGRSRLDVQINGVQLRGMYIGYTQDGSPAELRMDPDYASYWTSSPSLGFSRLGDNTAPQRASQVTVPVRLRLWLRHHLDEERPAREIAGINRGQQVAAIALMGSFGLVEVSASAEAVAVLINDDLLSNCSGTRFAIPSIRANDIAKHAAWAAPSSSSGFVPGFSP